MKLVCPRDGSSVPVHGLVLAAACPVLATALASLPPLDREDITILLADTSAEEVLPFLSHLYGQTLDNTDFSSWLFTLVDFALTPVLPGQQPPQVKLTAVKEEKPAKENPPTQIFDNALDEGDFMDDSGETESEEAKLAAVTRLVAESPARVKLADIAGPGRNTKVWRDFLQVRPRCTTFHLNLLPKVSIDGQPAAFLKCRHCSAVFPDSKTASSTALKRHSRSHAAIPALQQPEASLTAAEVRRLVEEEPHRVTEHSSGGSSDVWRTFRLLSVDGEPVGLARCQECRVVLAHSASCGTTSLKKHSMTHTEHSYSPHKKKPKLVEGEAGEGSANWDQEFIEDIKAELEAPSQKAVEPGAERGPGVSKFAICQLIQAASPRVTFQESTTHSAVWEKFVKIALDTVEVPFVCCKFCRKVYTHDRSLGTSSLIRHTCGDEPELDKVTKAGGLPRILVQELVNTTSARISRKEMSDKFNQRLPDVTVIFERVMVDSKETEYVSCKKCNKLYVFSVTKNSVLVCRKLELHECYIQFAPCVSSYAEPQDEKECFVIYVREPHRIVLKEKVKAEPNLHYFLLDGNKTDFAHCTKCCRFFPISSLNFNEERIHRCHKVKTADHNIQFKRKVPHQCDKCRSVFKSEHFLEIHQRREHGEGSATVMCSHCAKEFPTERLAKKHEMHVHYPEISKKFSCKDCNAMFHDRSKLKLHAMKHSNIKPYVCEQCGKGFNWVASFQDHMDMHGGVKKYTCEYCNRQFTKRNTLNNHRRLHTGEKPFMCPSPGCGMTFVQRTACKTHAKKRHNMEITMYTRNPEVPQTQASLAQMSLAQRAEQAVLQV